METNQTISVRDLATELSVDRSALRKHIVKQDHPTTTTRDRASRGQALLAVSQSVADKVRAFYAYRQD